MQVFGSIIWVLFSVMIIVGGVVGCFTPLEVVASLAFLLPIFLCVGGVADILYYFRVREFAGARALLFSGIFNLLLAIIFFSMGVESTSATIVYFVAFLAMFRGMLAFVSAFDLRQLHTGAFWVVLLLGVLNIAVAMIFIAFPAIGGITIGIMVSLFIVLFGIASLLGWWSARTLFRP